MISYSVNNKLSILKKKPHKDYHLTKRNKDKFGLSRGKREQQQQKKWDITWLWSYNNNETIYIWILIRIKFSENKNPGYSSCEGK